MRILLIIALGLIVSSCATTSKNPGTESKEPVSVKTKKPTHEGPIPTVIDYPSVQRLLNLDRTPSELGFSEKVFDTCQVGFGYPADRDCQRRYFTVIHFKLMCRDSEGTISTVLTDDDLRPISGETVNWYLKDVNGTTVTDSDGYGQIITTSSQSQKNQRLRIAVKSDFLFLKAGEINRLIAPKGWCNH